MLQNILVAEAEHVDWLEDQLELRAHIGLQNYVQTMIFADNTGTKKPTLVSAFLCLLVGSTSCAY